MSHLYSKKATSQARPITGPVSLTVVLCKIFEAILRDKIVKHLE